MISIISNSVFGYCCNVCVYLCDLNNDYGREGERGKGDGGMWGGGEGMGGRSKEREWGEEVRRG